MSDGGLPVANSTQYGLDLTKLATRRAKASSESMFVLLGKHEVTRHALNTHRKPCIPWIL